MTNAVKAPNPQRERQRKWYASLTPEQREARCIRQREAQRARRSRIKAGTYTGRNTADPTASLEKRRKRQREWMARKREQQKAEKDAADACRIVPDASKPVNGPSTPTKTQGRVQRGPARSGKPAEPGVKAQDLESYDELSSQKAKLLQKVWRKDMSDFLLDAITKKDSPFSGAGLRSSKAIFFWFNLAEKLDRIVEQEKPGQTEEFLLAVMLECLERLTGGKPTGSPPKIG